MSSSVATTIDVRTIPPRERHPLILGTFDALKPGEALQLVNDHDPEPLYYQFQARSPGSFEWAYLESGPQVWRVQISKTLAGANAAGGEDSCCSGGACCG
ncbi:MAG TPA: DUF2249 domain-containing protein [Albitalea sp.]|nr:DUF2249 domain-containing protein [Albitalea sp.]